MRGERSGRILVAAMALALLSCSDDTTAPATSFAADLSNRKELPDTISTNATGTATCTIASATISCTVTYAGLSGAPTASHIHLAAANANGGVRVNLCGAGTAPACPATTSGTITSGDQAATITGTQTAAQAFAQVADAIRNYGAYVNVHTTLHGGGETRGQLFRTN
jgi:hypothetical protein